MQKKIVLLFVLITFTISLSGNTQQRPKRAVTIVPVANLVLQRMATLFPGKNPWNCYQNISLEGSKKTARSCPRVHQLLFNEQVEIIHCAGDELLVKIPHVFYTSGIDKKNEYWAHKKNFISLEALEKKGLNSDLFPAPIRFSDKTIEKANTNTITLLFPFKDRTHHRTFSAGTRFVRAHPGANGPTVKVWAFNPATVRFDLISIPKHLCLSNPPKTSRQKRKLFVKLLKRWAHLPAGFIPYVWGGCSFTAPYKKNMITCKQMTIKPRETISVFLPKKGRKTVTGFDCSGVIARAAQACNIPYFFKNSSTALQQLKPITSYKQLAEGDLLYIKGHLMVVSDIKNNRLIEARSHCHGYGKVQEIKLSDEFQGIETYQQLLAACLTNKRLKRLDSRGAFTKSYTAKLLKLPT